MNAKSSAQCYVDDPRNAQVLGYVDGQFVPRDQAVVSVFDSCFVLCDGVWEGLRLVRGRLVELNAHMDRLYEGAGAIALDIGMPREALVAAVEATLQRNGMVDGVQVVIEVDKAHHRTGFNDRCTLTHLASGAMLAEGAQKRERQSGIGIEEHVL